MRGRLVSTLVLCGAALLVAALGLWVYLWLEYGQRPPAAPAAKSVNVRVRVIRPRARVRDSVSLPAVLEADRVVTVSAEVAGRVERLSAREGAACRAGETLLELNTDLLRADADRAAAQHKLAVATYARTKQLFDGGAARREQMDTAEAARDAAKAALDAARARLARATILAPGEGVLDELLVEKGEYVGPGTPVARIVDSARVKAAVMVPENDIQFVSAGKPAEVVIRIRDRRRTFAGTVTYVGRLADRRTRATRVEVTVENSEGLLRAGLIAAVRLQRRVLSDVVMVPLGAVIPTEKGHVVYVVEDRRSLRISAVCAGLKTAQIESQVAAPLRAAIEGLPGLKDAELSTRRVKLRLTARLEPDGPLPEEMKETIVAALKDHPAAKAPAGNPPKSVVLCRLEAEFAAGTDMRAARRAVGARLEALRARVGDAARFGKLLLGTAAAKREVQLDTSLVETFDGEQHVRVTRGLSAGDRLIVAGHRFVGPGQAVRVENPSGGDQAPK
jgi:RND family efflux transporter MFP subunit